MRAQLNRCFLSSVADKSQNSSLIVFKRISVKSCMCNVLNSSVIHKTICHVCYGLMSFMTCDMALWHVDIQDKYSDYHSQTGWWRR